MQYEDVNRTLLTNFPDFFIEEDDLDLPYIVASSFIRFLLDSYNNDGEAVYKQGLRFIEQLHKSECEETRELATIGYLESLLDWPDKDALLKDLGSESKKWWIELNLFWNGKIKYVGESFAQSK